MGKNRSRSVVFYLDQHFGAPRIQPHRKNMKMVGLDVLPHARENMMRLKEKGYDVFLASRSKVLKKSEQDLKHYLPHVDGLVLSQKSNEDLVKNCVQKIGKVDNDCLFVAADLVLRDLAAQNGFTALAHPALIRPYMEESELSFLRISGKNGEIPGSDALIPYFLERFADGSWRSYGVGTLQRYLTRVDENFEVQVLPLDISRKDPVLVKFDANKGVKKERLEGLKPLCIDGDKMLVAMGPSPDEAARSLVLGHGATQRLFPNPDLTSPPPQKRQALNAYQSAMRYWPHDRFKLKEIAHEIDLSRFVLRRAPATEYTIHQLVDRFSGQTDLDDDGPVISRHVLHPDNSRAVYAVKEELRSMGYCVHSHFFSYMGNTYSNITADLPGKGYFIIHPDILEKIRDLFIRYPLPDPVGPWLEQLRHIIGDEILKKMQFGKASGISEASAIELRHIIEERFCLRPWYPWWQKLCPLPGPGAGLVVVGCHVDSTASREPVYNPAVDSAPGADDDASGIAATLEIARYFSDFLRGKLTHTVRFCFFNAEEVGIVGSQAYAGWLKSWNAPVRAVICIDMIGYNSDAERIYEIHAGYTDPAVRDASVPIAETIANWSAAQGSLSPAQIYRGTNSGSGSDRTIYDGAINRSDHGSFHQQGYPAVVLSEDFFINLASEPAQDANPNYHKQLDTGIDNSYAADITCAIARAVQELAQ
ncbi:hypothetical protein DSCA_62930 [Desulfosarcina alkanivorans]|uniref:Peptidase M28 domain-containing protein n=1 Tax=Desulfosarcina alkanivorans TaxID=571177 RepID=A0A5K7YWL0_9BACT|nr:M28 family metallopeptidase [Desulfosarcina alkanivorans]BBO72363.1 hypothetical protein DSCA_62930 [Desulfosarcina alkanivorans]